MKKLVGALLILGLSACSSIDFQPFIPPVEETPLGEWTLSRVETQPLPFVLSQQGEDKTELISGSLDLSPTGIAQLERVTRITLDGVETTETQVRSGTFQFTAISVGIDWDDPGCDDSLNYDPVVDELSGFDCELATVMTWERVN